MSFFSFSLGVLLQKFVRELEAPVQKGLPDHWTNPWVICFHTGVETLVGELASESSSWSGRLVESADLSFVVA